MTENVPKQHDDGEKKSRVRLVAAIILLALLVAFVIDNTRRIKVGFVFTDHETRLIYVLIATALIGVLLDRLWLRWRHNR